MYVVVGATATKERGRWRNDHKRGQALMALDSLVFLS
jgi:hypothetical protein